MDRILFDRAYFIKLGRGGKWEEQSIKQGRLLFGWSELSIEEVNSRLDTSEVIEKLGIKDKGARTRDHNALKSICNSGPDDLWITFYRSQLWWCRLASGQVMQNDDPPYKYRCTADGWHNRSTNGQPLAVADIPGSISKLQGFRGTVCQVAETGALLRLINGEESPEYAALKQARIALSSMVERAIQSLHWRDFEILVDLVFRQSGWRRESTLGETMKGIDLYLRDPITQDPYCVQVKSACSKREFLDCVANNDLPVRKFYFVVHSPDEDLASFVPENDRDILLLPSRLADMVVGAGLVDWLLAKVR